jgi:hypothetical protein
MKFPEPNFEYEKPLFFVLTIESGGKIIERFRGSWNEIVNRLPVACDGLRTSSGPNWRGKFYEWEGDDIKVRVFTGPTMSDLESDDCRPARWDAVREWLGLDLSAERIVEVLKMDDFRRVMALTALKEKNSRAAKLLEEVAVEKDKYK